MANRIRALREQRGWTQHELAAHAGVSRQLVGAIEAGRHTPNVTAALAVARTLGVTVEELFAPAPPSPGAEVITVLGEPTPIGAPVVTATVGDRVQVVPVGDGVSSSESWVVADAVVDHTGLSWLPDGAADGLVIAGCDPVLGLLAGLVERRSPHRLVVVHASTGRSIDALAAGRVHAALVHAPERGLPRPPVDVRRWHVARWQVGLAARSQSGPPSIEEIAERRTPVIQRDPGAGSQLAFERALQAVGAHEHVPGPVADGHVDAARRVAQGAGRAGVTMEAAARAFGLGFRPLEHHGVELWVDERWAALPAVTTLIEVLNGTALAPRAERLGGYDLAGCGSERRAD